MTANRYAFDDKVVLVTGGGSGIGQSIARAFLDNGARVAVAGRRREKLDETLGDHGGRGLAVATDVSDPEQARALVDTVVERFGRLDVFVNNAAAYVNKPFLEMTTEEWTHLQRTNVDAFFHLAQRALPELEKTGGNVVVVGSVSGLRGDWGQAGYNGTKAQLMNLVQSLALDFGPKGVRLNAVAPSFTVTEITAPVSEDRTALDAFANRIALGRPAEPDDIAPAVLFLASPDARYVTGAFLAVDGGTSASTGQPHL
jgi:meso-butanediol dehydrogenase / (S,S)-butanediol dehydrogenase / diacetyl reductase